MATRFPHGIIATVTGNIVGNITGNVTGNVTGAVTGNVTGNVTGDLTGNVTGNLTGAVTGTSVTASTDKTDYKRFIGPKGPVNFATGTWTYTRIAQANYVMRHSAADETSIISVEIVDPFRTTTSKGFKLTSIDYAYSIGTASLDAHAATLDLVTFGNGSAVTVTSVPVTASLGTANQANPFLTTITVTTPAFNNANESKYVLEISVNHSATSAYDFYGLCLQYTRNDL